MTPRAPKTSLAGPCLPNVYQKWPESLGAQGVEKWDNLYVYHVSTKGYFLCSNGPGFLETGAVFVVFFRVVGVLYFKIWKFMT
jgi:hypothetical protein